MKVLIVQHIECEGPGYLGDFLHDNGIEYEIARMYEGEQLPDIFDALIVLGGPMNVYAEERYPYLKRLNITIKNFVIMGGHYLGFCLGGQLLAKALGAKVRKNQTKEVGNFENRSFALIKLSGLKTLMGSSFILRLHQECWQSGSKFMKTNSQKRE